MVNSHTKSLADKEATILSMAQVPSMAKSWEHHDSNQNENQKWEVIAIKEAANQLLISNIAAAAILAPRAAAAASAEACVSFRFYLCSRCISK